MSLRGSWEGLKSREGLRGSLEGSEGAGRASEGAGRVSDGAGRAPKGTRSCRTQGTVALRPQGVGGWRDIQMYRQTYVRTLIHCLHCLLGCIVIVSLLDSVY